MVNIKSKIKFYIIFIIFFLFNFFCYSENVTTTINIISARQTSYEKDEKTKNDIIILEGSVELSIQNGSSVSEIKADKITYDRKTEMLFAEGNVEVLTKSSSSGGETTTANSLLLNTSTLEGVFDGGRVVQTQSDAINLPSGSTLIVFSDLFSKDQNNTIAFKNSSLTFCDEENPHWHIDASRTWLLPGGEFAFFNALLYVGSVPIFYFPAFYYPKDELIFNPVFSTRKREGYSIQTTTYLIGRKGLNNSSSTSESSSSDSSAESLKALYNFMKPNSLKEQKREGLILHNLDKDFTGDTSNYLKFMADWYSKLGYMVGLDGVFKPSEKYITDLNFSSYLGISNTIYVDSSGNYLAYEPNSGEKTKDESYFMGLRLPFRYALNFGMTISKPFKLTLSFPLYSDPYFNYDFLINRSESMDWISYFVDQTSEETVSISEYTSFAWKISASYSPSIPAILKPYISSSSLSITSAVDVNSKSATNLSSISEEMPSSWQSYTPLRKFYYPSSVSPISANLSVSGTLFQWPKTEKLSSSKVSYIYDLNKPDSLKSESELNEPQKKDDDKEVQSEDSSENILIEPSLPKLEYSVSQSSSETPFSNKLTYSINPSLSTQISYDSSILKNADDFDWENIKSSMYTLKMPITLSNAMNYYGNYFSMTNNISYNPIWQHHPNTDGYDETNANTLKLADYKAESQSISNSNTVSLKPFTYNKMFSETGISWDSTIQLYQREFIGDANSPEWENNFVDFTDSDCVTVNSLNMTLAMSEMNNNFKQSLVFSAIMPPLLKQYTATLNLTFPYTNFTLSTGLKEPSKGAEFYEWTKNDLQQSFSFSKTILNSTFKFSESYNYDLEDFVSNSLKLSLSWYNFSSSYVCSYTKGADFKDESTGWVLNEEMKFRPYSLSFSFSPTTKTFYTWFNRISFAPSLSTSLTADLIRPTNSSFVFAPSITFKITDFFNITFSSNSKNSVLYRYVQSFLGHKGLIRGEENIFIDLLNSFAFGNTEKRKSSGFKLKSLNMTMSHELHDWTFNMTMKISPRLVIDGSNKYYDFSPYISIGVVWNPMQSMKTTIIREAESTNSPNMIWKLNSE